MVAVSDPTSTKPNAPTQLIILNCATKHRTLSKTFIISISGTKNISHNYLKITNNLNLKDFIHFWWIRGNCLSVVANLGDWIWPVCIEVTKKEKTTKRLLKLLILKHSFHTRNNYVRISFLKSIQSNFANLCAWGGGRVMIHFYPDKSSERASTWRKNRKAHSRNLVYR